MRPFGGQCHCALFSEVRILGDTAFTREPIAHQNGVRARGQYSTPCYNILTE